MMLKSIKIGEYQDFRGINLKFNKGITIITGNSGTGKTRLFNLIKGALTGNKNPAVTLETKGKSHPGFMALSECVRDAIIAKDSKSRKRQETEANQILSKLKRFDFRIVIAKDEIKAFLVPDAGHNFYNSLSRGERQIVLFAVNLAYYRLFGAKMPLLLDRPFVRLEPGIAIS